MKLGRSAADMKIPQMAKAGDAYQDAVAEVMRQVDPRARVNVGEWIEGPDGGRDCDVGVYPSSGSLTLVYIECKDRKRPVGIEFIDALDSKRKDVKADVAIICSNSGFTTDALRKAARVGIPALSALKEGDSRIRVRVEEEIYTRKMRVSDYQTIYHFVGDTLELDTIRSRVKPNEITHAGLLVAAWVRDRCTPLVGMTARSCTILAEYRFWRPLQFHFGGVIAPVRGIDLKIPCHVQWCSQIVRLSASSGMYDYLQHRVILGRGQQQYHIHDVAYDKWAPIDFVPPNLHFAMKPPHGGAQVCLGLISGIDNVGGALAPEINSYVQSEKIERTDSQGETDTIDLKYSDRQEKTAILLDTRPRTSVTIGQVRQAEVRGSSLIFTEGKIGPDNSLKTSRRGV